MRRLFMVAEELDQKPRDRVQHQIPTENFPSGVRAARAQQKEYANERFSECFVKLRGMQWHAERNADQFVGIGIREGNGPWQMAFDSPAASGRKAAQPADGVSRGDSGSKHVGGFQ